MRLVQFPADHRLIRLSREHRRRDFRSGEPRVDAWLATKALQHQEKRLSTTKVLLEPSERIAGYYTLSSAHIDFADLPASITTRLPKRTLPAAVLAWLGVDKRAQRQGLGTRLLAQALRDCWEAGKTLPFVAVVLDCLSESSKGFYAQWEFAEIPGHPFRMVLSAKLLEAMMHGE